MGWGNGLAVFSIVFGLVVAIAVTRHYTASPTVLIGMAEVAVIDPAQVGLALSMRLGGRTCRNLYVLEITLRNRGPRDLDFSQPPSDELSLRPRIEFPPGLRVVVDPWTDSDRNSNVDVRLARELRIDDGVQMLHVHPRRLKAGATIRIRAVCTSLVGRPSLHLEATEFDFYPGSLTGVDFVGTNLLTPPPRYLRE